MVSIVMPLHNKGKYVVESIESVIAQTIPAWELLIVENYSNDAGPLIAQKIAEKDSRVCYCEAPSFVRGPGAARNFGLDKAQGEWVLFLDADDLISPGYLKEKLDSAARVPDAPLVVGCWREFQDAKLEVTTKKQPAAFLHEPQYVRDVAVGFAPWILHCSMVKRAWIENNRRWPEELDSMPSEDAAFWFRILIDVENIAWCQNDGALHRVGISESREGSTGALMRAMALQGVVEHNLRCLSKNKRTPSNRQCETLARVFEQSAWTLCRVGEKSEAAKVIKIASFWLSKTHSIAPSLLLRKILGLELFAVLRVIHTGFVRQSRQGSD
jgi:glycosyltransferase involved in cell wall biosynthesis